MYLPDTEHRRNQMVRYNKHIMQPQSFEENETVRFRKRKLKEDYKRCMQTHTHKAKYSAVNQFMDDIYFLNGYSKQGVPLSAKRQQWPTAYKQPG